MEDTISEVENELHEASEEVRKLPVERRTAEVEKPRASDTSKAVLDGRTVLRAQSSEGEAGLAAQQRSETVGESFRRRPTFCEEHGELAKTRKAAVRKESAGTQEYESSQLNDMDVDMDENKKELSFIPIAVSSSDDCIYPKSCVTGNVRSKVSSN